MDTPPNQPWDFGQAVAEFSSGIVKGVMDFVGLVMRPFDDCGLGHQSEVMENEQTEDDSGVLSVVAARRSKCAAVAVDGRLVMHGGPSKGKPKSRRLTEETLGTLSLVGALACRGSSSAGSSSNTLNLSNDSSTGCSVSSADGDDYGGVDAQDTRPRVTFDHGVEVRVEWRDYLARTGHEANTGRDRAATMVDGDDFWSLLEAASAVPTTTVQPQRVLSRAARFAMIDDDDNGNGNDKDGRKPIAYGRMKDIVSSRRGGINGNCAEDSGGGKDDDEDEDDDEEDGLMSLFESYDGSLASLKCLVFPPTISGSHRSYSRPAKKLFDSSAPASRSPAKWMTPAELDGILGRTKGWKEGTGGNNNRKSGRRRARRKESYCFDKKRDVGTSVRDEMCHVSVDNSVLKDELFGLATQEHRTSLLFKRAFLNWEENSSCL